MMTKNEHVGELHLALINDAPIDYYGQRRLLTEHNVTHGFGGITTHTFTTDQSDTIIIRVVTP